MLDSTTIRWIIAGCALIEISVAIVLIMDIKARERKRNQ